MATRNRTILYRKYRDALKSVRVPAGSSPSISGSGGAVIEMSTTSLLNPKRSYTPLSTEDPGSSRRNPRLDGCKFYYFLKNFIFPSELKVIAGTPRQHSPSSLAMKVTATVQYMIAIVSCLCQKISKFKHSLDYRRSTVAVGLPPAWVDVSEEIAANVQRLRVKMAELAKAHAKALMPSFGDGKEDQRRIEALTQEITDLLKRSEKRLQRLSAAGPSEDSNIRKNVQRSLATDLQSLSMELRRKQSTYLKRLQQQKEGPDGVDLEMNLNGSNPKGEDDDFDDIGFSEHQMAKLKKSEAFTAEREREIQQVVESVNELAQIMKDLSVLVIDQGTIVDRIDYNITNVAVSVEEGLKQLEKAERSQKQGDNLLIFERSIFLNSPTILNLHDYRYTETRSYIKKSNAGIPTPK
ncbi:syntaxin [Sesamum angolense]|uniref:Syntaxin n=1 Tax=Sesamum angolense TaxID=2727404 RepID=A0AAE1WYR0_9LAMI|nr:syntaxin [Sesamum angolense]